MNTDRRRLNKRERDVVELAAEESFFSVLPLVHSIEKEVVDALIPNVSDELAPHAVRKFMNLLGQEIWSEAELWTSMN